MATDGETAPSATLVIGEGTLADATDRAAGRRARLVRLREPSDPEIREATEAGIDVAVVVSPSDVRSLRAALVVEHARPGTPWW